MRELEDIQLSTLGGPRTTTAADRFVALCLEVFRREMPELLDELFSKLDEALYDLADKSGTNTPDATYFEAMGIFRQRRDDILSLFLENLRKDLDGDAAAQPRTEFASESTDRDTTGIKLIGGAELEENLAITNLISKAENRYEIELTELRRHLADLRGKERIHSRTDPLGPHRICIAFRQALSPVDEVELAIKLIVYKLFDKQVIDQLGPIYASCRECAAGSPMALGTRPRLVVHRTSSTRSRKDAGQGRTNGLLRASGGIGLRGRAVSSAPDRKVAFRDFQRLLGRSRRPGNARAEGRIVLGTAELMSALSRLQESAAQVAESGELRRYLGAELHLGGGRFSGRALNRMDEDTLELVLLLFEHALQGNRIPVPLKALIGRLEIPILKVALVDKSFFEDKHHPARRLLNHLAQVAFVWSDDGDRSPSSVYDCIDRIVDRITARDAPSPAIFAEADAELSDLLSKEREAAQSQEVKAQQDLEQRERQTNVEQLVNMAINQSLRGGSVPDSVASLLYEGWHVVLVAAYLRGGAGGEQWQSAMRTMDRLVWSVQPKVADDERRELLRTIPELLRTLRESLARVAYDQRRLARWFKELQALHITALRGDGSALARTAQQAPPAVTPRIESDDGDLDTAAVPEWTRFNAGQPQVAGLRTGSWIELWREDGSLVRAKLAWRSPRSGIYLFVDRHGHNVLELSGEDIAKLAQRGTLTVLGEAPILDRSMQELVESLTDGPGL